MMRHILHVLAWVTTSTNKFLLKENGYKWLEEQEKLAGWVHLPSWWHILSTIEKWSSFLETKRLLVSLGLANQCRSLPISCQLLHLPSIYFPTCVLGKSFAASFILSSLDTESPEERESSLGKTKGSTYQFPSTLTEPRSLNLWRKWFGNTALVSFERCQKK